MKRRFSRRDVLKVAQVGGLSAAAGALGLVGVDFATTGHASGICRICTMHCGLKATTRRGKLMRVDGDLQSRTRGFVCHHGWALREIVHSPDRLKTPLARTGRGRLTPVSWEEALGGVADRMQRIKSTWGAEAVAIQAGWPFVRHPLFPFMQRLMLAFGSPNVASVASLCASSGHIARMMVTGSFIHPDLKDTRTLMLWGANPEIADPALAHVVSGKALAPHQLIVVDPTRTELAAKAAVHLRPRPGTDGALALGMIRLVIDEALYDPAFVREQTLGFDELAVLARDYPPDVVERLTSVPAADLVRATRLFAREGPGATWDSLGVQHHANGLQTARAIASLCALLGYVDVPGGMRLLNRAEAGFWERPLPTFYSMSTAEPVPPPVDAKPIGYQRFPLFELYNREAQGMLFPEAILEDKPYPLRGLLCLASNPLVTHPDSGRWSAAADKLELLVSVDPFLSETGRRAHFVLPASTFAESPTVDAGDATARVSDQSLVPPQHESWPDWRILFALAGRLGLARFFPWSSFETAQTAPRVAYLRDPERELRPESRPAGTPPPRFATRSGRLEFVSHALARFGHPPLPEWTPPAAVPDERFPLYLVTGPRTRAYVNSQFRGVPSIRRMMPEPFAELHPKAAALAAVVDGGWVRIITATGELGIRVRVTDRVHPETVVVPGGWARANANQLTTLDGLDPISGFPVFRSLVCRVEPSSGA